MIKLYKLLLIIFFGSIYCYTQASAYEVSEYLQRSCVILDRLVNQGILKVGTLDLYEVKTQLPDIHWRKIEVGESKPTFTENRSSAYYTRSDKTVTILSVPREFSHETKDILSLHEALGALGYNDKDYEISLNLHILSILPNGPVKSFVKQSMDVMNHPVAQQNLLIARGGTSVGGGGDLVGITVKLRVLQYLMSQHQVRLSFYLAFSLIKFEPNYDPSIKNFSYALYNSEVKGNLDELFDQKQIGSIVVPAQLWIRSTDRERDQLVKEISELIFQFENMMPNQGLF